MYENTLLSTTIATELKLYVHVAKINDAYRLATYIHMHIVKYEVKHPRCKKVAAMKKRGLVEKL